MQAQSISEICKCFIWDTIASISNVPNYDRYQVYSKRTGGSYQISRSASVNLKNYNEPDYRIKLTTWLVEERLNGKSIPYIDTDLLERISKRSPLDYSKRIESFFLGINNVSPLIGGAIKVLDDPLESLNLNRSDYTADFDIQSLHSFEIGAWFEARTTEHEEVWGFIKHLEEKRLIDTKTSHADEYSFKITPSGWNFIEALIKPVKRTDKAFVAMWFDEGLKDVYTKQISSALVECGYIGEFRIDQVEHINKIDDQIMAKINGSSLVVVDLTCPLIPHKGEIVPAYRGGVYFEAGYAMGLDIPIIWTCKKDNVDHIHFDLRQFNQILWHEEGGEYFVGSGRDRISFEKALVNRITAINMNRKIRYN